jgi:uncharacterized protein (TIGR00299 family) protein
MSVAYFDCFAGAGGDMIVGALLDAGADFTELKTALGTLEIGNCALSAETVCRGGLSVTMFRVCSEEQHPPHRDLAVILEMIDGTSLSQRVKERVKGIFTRLAEAEAKVHRIDVKEVTFHEVGAIDSIMDVVGACIALELLGIDRIFSSPIPVGSGTFACDHGVLPAPAPATMELLIGAQTAQSDLPGEITTPTAAAVLTTLAESYGPIPAMNVKAVGYGAGTRETEAVPNVLRAIVGDLSEAGNADSVVELSANIDDTTGEILGATIERLLASGCLDAWAAPVFMKKSRPAWTLFALCGEADTEQAQRIIFEETTTFGVRRRIMTRSKLLREYVTVETEYGPVRIKIGRFGNQEITASPEFADARAAAQAHGVAIRQVIAAAEAAYRAEKQK